MTSVIISAKMRQPNCTTAPRLHAPAGAKLRSTFDGRMPRLFRLKTKQILCFLEANAIGFQDPLEVFSRTLARGAEIRENATFAQN
jgi:hypothetical protein